MLMRSFSCPATTFSINFDMKLTHFYSGDTKLYVHITHKHVAHAFDRLKTCLDDVRRGLSANMLKLNPDRIEFINFGSKMHHVKTLNKLIVNTFSNFFSPSEAVRNFGVWIGKF